MNTFWSQSYASWNPLATSTQDNIVINGFSLQSQYIKTSTIQESNAISLTSFDFPKNNGKGLLWYFKRWKEITLMTTVKWESVTDFNSRLDELRKNLFQEQVNLDVKTDGVIRRIKVNCTGAPKNIEHYNNTFLKMEISLTTLEPFFYELSNQTNSFLNKTTSFADAITNQGSAESDIRAYFLFNAWTAWVTTVTLAMGNNTITINESITAGDSLYINGETKEVQLNWSDIDYTWQFPFLSINTNYPNFTIDWTFDVDINILNKKNYV